MQRRTFEIQIADNLVRYRTRIDDEPTEEFSAEATVRQFQFMHALLEQPGLLKCGPEPFQKMKLYHSGTSWVVETEAEGPKLQSLE